MHVIAIFYVFNGLKSPSSEQTDNVLMIWFKDAAGLAMMMMMIVIIDK